MSKGTTVEYFKPEYDFKLKKNVCYGLKSCTLSNDSHIFIWGSRESVILPKGSKVNFTWDELYINNETFIQVRAKSAILGRDCILPSLGAVKKGMIIYFKLTEEGYGKNPNIGTISLSN